MPLSFRGLFVCVPFLDLVVGNAQQNLAGHWVADFTPGAANYVTVSAYTTLGTPVAWAIASPGAAPVGAVDPNDATIYRIPLNNAANVVDVANTITVTATAAGLVQVVDIVIKPVVQNLTVVPDHFTFQDAAGANYAPDLTGRAIAPPAGQLTSNLVVQTAPASPAAWSHVHWNATQVPVGLGYVLTAVDGSTRGIRLDGVKTIRTAVSMLDTLQVMPPAVTVAVRAPVNGANLANGLALDLHSFTFAGAGHFAVTQEDAPNFNAPYPAGWDPVNDARPQGYTANQALAANAVTLVVTAVPAANSNVALRSSAYYLVPTAPGVLPVVHTVVVNHANAGPQAIAAAAIVGTQVAYGNLALGAVPNAVLYNNPLMIFWEVSDDGGAHWSPLRLTTNTVYVTAQAPVATADLTLNTGGAVYKYDSFLAMSCGVAAGIAGGVGTAAAVRDAIAGLFNPANPNPRVQRLNRAGGGGPTQLGYWLNHGVWSPAQSINGGAAVTAAGLGNLFTNPHGNIACGVWAKMLMCLWALHGKGDGHFVEVLARGPGLVQGGGLPATPNVGANARFNVRNWTYNNHANLNPGNYTHTVVAPVGAPLPPVGIADQAASITNGVAGQNMANPPAQFVNHFIVRDGLLNSFYDPSYGAVALTRNVWAENALGGLQRAGQAGFVAAVPGSVNGISPNQAAVALYDRTAAAWVP